VELKILREARKTNSRIITLDFWRTDFGLFWDLLGRIQWEAAMEDTRAQESWLNFLRE